MDNWIDNLRRIGLKRYGDENRRILSELLRNGIPAGNTVMSEASAEALIIAVAAMIEENNKISAKIMAEKLGVSLRTVQRLIKENDQIEYVGHGFSGYWKIK